MFWIRKFHSNFVGQTPSLSILPSLFLNLLFVWSFFPSMSMCLALISLWVWFLFTSVSYWEECSEGDATLRFQVVLKIWTSGRVGDEMWLTFYNEDSKALWVNYWSATHSHIWFLEIQKYVFNASLEAGVIRYNLLINSEKDNCSHSLCHLVLCILRLKSHKNNLGCSCGKLLRGQVALLVKDQFSCLFPNFSHQWVNWKVTPVWPPPVPWEWKVSVVGPKTGWNQKKEPFGLSYSWREKKINFDHWSLMPVASTYHKAAFTWLEPGFISGSWSFAVLFISGPDISS